VDARLGAVEVDVDLGGHDGVNGASSWRHGDQAGAQRPERRGSPSQKRRRERRTYQLERSSTKAAIARPRSSRASVHPFADGRGGRARRESTQRSRSFSARPARSAGDPVGVRVEHVEAVGVVDWSRNWPHGLADRLDENR
jgi:hypothetical protein